MHDVATEHGTPVEVTDDWYAQDRAGNVWYLGEHTTEYKNGKPRSTEGRTGAACFSRATVWS